MKHSNGFLTFVLLILAAPLSWAQDDDVSLWNSVKIEYQPNKQWELGLEGQLRIKEDISVIDEYFPEFTLARRLIKGMKVAVGIRYIKENDTKGNIQGYEDHLRLHADLGYKHDIGMFTMRYRLRYQNKNELGISKDEGDMAIQRIRLKLGMEYNIPNWKLDPVLSGELFRRFENGTESTFDKYRVSLGTSSKIKKAGKIGVFYRIDQGIKDMDRSTLHIIGLKYTYTFD